MTNEQYLKIQNRVVQLTGEIAQLELDEFLLRIERAEALGPSLDPTLSRAAAKNLGIIKRLAQSLKPAQRAHQEASREMLNKFLKDSFIDSERVRVPGTPTKQAEW